MRAPPSNRLRLLASLLLVSTGALPAADEVLRPRVVVVAMFEPGEDTGDAPGEFQLWVEREQLNRILPLPAGYRSVRANADGTVLGVVTGVGNTNAAATLTALGLDPRFDLRKSYWLVAGIAGVDPADASLGSAVWARFVVEGDLAHEIDAREIPAGWPTGYVPLRKRTPYEQPLLADSRLADQVYELEPGLVAWAHQLTQDTPLADHPGLARRREAYTGAEFAAARRPPFVLVGDNLASSTYWHGRLLNRWANDWVAYYTGGRGRYVTTAMEDSGTLRALANLTRAGRADVRRALVLRTASNFDMQWPGTDAATSLAGEKPGQYSALLPALEAAHAVGRRVVRALVDGWDRYEHTPPSAPGGAGAPPPR